MFFDIPLESAFTKFFFQFGKKESFFKYVVVMNTVQLKRASKKKRGNEKDKDQGGRDLERTNVRQKNMNGFTLSPCTVGAWWVMELKPLINALWAAAILLKIPWVMLAFPAKEKKLLHGLTIEYILVITGRHIYGRC
jgi:hypothetical protein